MIKMSDSQNKVCVLMECIDDVLMEMNCEVTYADKVRSLDYVVKAMREIIRLKGLEGEDVQYDIDTLKHYEEELYYNCAMKHKENVN